MTLNYTSQRKDDKVIRDSLFTREGGPGPNLPLLSSHSPVSWSLLWRSLDEPSSQPRNLGWPPAQPAAPARPLMRTSFPLGAPPPSARIHQSPGPSAAPLVSQRTSGTAKIKAALSAEGTTSTLEAQETFCLRRRTTLMWLRLELGAPLQASAAHSRGAQSLCRSMKPPPRPPT